MKTILKGGRVIDPANARDGDFDVLIANGAVARIGRDLPVEDAEVFEIRRGGRRAWLLPMLNEDPPQLLDYAE